MSILRMNILNIYPYYIYVYLNISKDDWMEGTK